jgi:hypothetical protein
MQQFYGTWVTYQGKTRMGGIGKEKETKNLNVVDVLTVKEQIK